MKRLLLLPGLMAFLACSRPPASFLNPHTTIARLNDATWFGRATAIEASALTDSACSAGAITLFFATTLSYPGDRLRLSPEQAAAQAGEFVPRQRLTFQNVPAKRGTYRLTTLLRCDNITSRQGNFVLLLNGSGIAESYFAKTRKAGWVRISAIDSVARTVSGRFRATLVSPAGRVARFRRGWFSAAIPKTSR